jgi:hypothetical protein
VEPVATIVDHATALVAELGEVALPQSVWAMMQTRCLTARTEGEMMALDILWCEEAAKTGVREIKDACKRCWAKCKMGDVESS